MFFKETFPLFLIEGSQEGLFLLKAPAGVRSVRRGSVALEVVLHEEVEFHQVVSVEPNLVLPPIARGVGESGGPVGDTSRPLVGGGWNCVGRHWPRKGLVAAVGDVDGGNAGSVSGVSVVDFRLERAPGVLSKKLRSGISWPIGGEPVGALWPGSPVTML